MFMVPCECPETICSRREFQYASLRNKARAFWAGSIAGSLVLFAQVDQNQYDEKHADKFHQFHLVPRMTMKRLSILLLGVALSDPMRVLEDTAVQPDFVNTQLIRDSVAQTDDGWQQFRGRHGLGIDTSGIQFPERLDVEKTLRWKAPASKGHSSPIVVGESIILTGHAGDQLITQCFQLHDGSLRWQRELTVTKLEKSYHHGPATPTAVSDGQRIYCVFGSLGVIAYDLAGTELWRKQMEPANNLYGTAASPILVGNRLLVFLSDQTEAKLLALDKATGHEIWNRNADGPASSWATPAVWPQDNPQLILIYEPYHLRAISLDDGKELWSIPGLADEPIAIPQVVGNLVIVTSYNMRTNQEVIGLPTFAEALKECDSNGDGKINPEESKKNKSVLSRPDADGEGDHPLHSFFRMLDENRDLQIEAAEWPRLQNWVDSFNHANGFIGLRMVNARSAPEMIWRAETGVPECPTSLTVRDGLFAVRNGGVVTFLNLADGKTLFRKRVAPGGPYYASPILADGKIFLASARGEVSVLSAEIPFKVLSKADLGEPIWATPALSRQVPKLNSASGSSAAQNEQESTNNPNAHGLLIFRSEKHLWAFEKY
jgi:outer membrane protein assembly factor BamB